MKNIEFITSLVLIYLVTASATSSCSSNSCLNGGVCGDTVDGFICKCPKCYSGDTCEINTCHTSVVIIVLRVVLLTITAFLGIFALFMFIYRVRIVAREQSIPATRIAGTSLTSCRSTTYKGRDSLVLRPKSATSGSLCSSVYNVVTPKVKSPPKQDKTLEQKLEEWHTRNAAAIAARQSNGKKRRAPAWDEVEMRRHGLINRYCDRVYHPDCPSNPSSVEVSCYNGLPGNSTCSQASIKFNQPSDSASDYSQMPSPFASSTPQSQPISGISQTPSLKVAAPLVGTPVRLVGSALNIPETSFNNPINQGFSQHSVYMEPGLAGQSSPAPPGLGSVSGTPPIHHVETALSVSETMSNKPNHPTPGMPSQGLAQRSQGPTPPQHSVYADAALHDGSSKYYAF